MVELGTEIPVPHAYDIAGVKPVTFRAWHGRIGLLAGRKEGAPLTAIEICVLRAVVVLTAFGIPASAAVPLSQSGNGLLFALMDHWNLVSPRPPRFARVFRVRPGTPLPPNTIPWHVIAANNSSRIGDVRPSAPEIIADACVEIDLVAIVEHVREALEKEAKNDS